MIFRIALSLLWVLCLAVCSNAQDRTVGLLGYDQEKAFPGYNLLFPHNQGEVYLLNNCGEIVHRWSNFNDRVPGNSVYLQDDGSIIRCSRNLSNQRDSIWAGGGGGFVEAVSWDGELLWSFYQNDSISRLHHDIEILPNGNVLMISWELKDLEESLTNGRKEEKLFLNKLWPDYILEYSPSLDSIVWEWHAWDHMIQDIDSSLANFGVVSENPGRIDINYETNLGNPDWLHINAIDYNPELDQIILSVPNFNEIWIIDHSTTTEEAKSSQGGVSGVGGDLLFRWGNPQTYQKGDSSDQKLFFQHDVQWINDFIDPVNPLYNHVLLYNNRAGNENSTVNVLQTPFNQADATYDSFNGTFLPAEFTQTVTHTLLSEFYSSGLSSAQFLPNGNFLVLSGRYGYAFEIDPEGKIVWQYRVPLKGGDPVTQGTVLEHIQNSTFRLKRYPVDFPAFIGRDLNPKGVIQLNEENDYCQKLTSNEDLTLRNVISMFPNPANEYLNVKLEDIEPVRYQIIDISGRLRMQGWLRNTDVQLDIKTLERGAYSLFIEQGPALLFMKN